MTQFAYAAAETPPPVTLKADAAGYYTLQEASGATREDEGSGGIDLADNNTVGQAQGHIEEFAADFNAAGNTYLEAASSSGHQFGAVSLAIGGWVYLDAKSSDRVLWSKWSSAAGNYSYRCYYDSSEDAFAAEISLDGTATTSVVDTASVGSPSTGTWYHVMMNYDLAGVLYIYTNGTEGGMSAHSGGFYGSSAAKFRLGADEGGNYLDGRLEHVILLSGGVTGAELAYLYRSGLGRDLY